MFDAPIYICVQNMAFRIVIGITVSFVQEIRSESPESQKKPLSPVIASAAKQSPGR
jgi:hypothetical protein